MNIRGASALAGGMLILLISGSAAAATIAGKVTDVQFGTSLAGVTLELTGRTAGGDDHRQETTTSEAGAYTFAEVPPGRYRLQISSPAYQTKIEEIKVTAAGEVRLDVALELDAVLLDDLVVTGQTGDTEGALQTGLVQLDAETLELVPGIVEPDPIRALQVLPGVQAASDISSGLYIRGGGPDQTLVLMDGVTVYNPTHAFGFFSTFNNDAVEDITLYKGAYPAAYGGRLGAVLDVGMRRSSSEKISGKVGISLISARAMLQGRLGDDRWLVSARRSYLEPILGALRTEENPIPDFYFYDLNATYATSRLGGRTSLVLYRGRDKINVDADVNTFFEIGWGNTVAALKQRFFFSEVLEGEVMLSSSQYKSLTDAEIFATGFEIDNQLQDISLTGKLDWRTGQQHNLDFGLGSSWYDFTYQQSFNKDILIDYGSQPQELFAYIEDRWFPSDRTTIRTGLRTRLISDGERFLIEPRLSISQTVGPGIRLKAGAGVYNQFLQLVTTEGFSAGDFYLPIDETANLGNSWQVVVGTEWELNASDLLSVEIYNNDLSDLVELDTTAPVDQSSTTAEDVFVTGGTGYARGVEIFARRKLGNLTGWLGYTQGWTRRQFAALNDGNSYPPKYDRRHDINAVLSYQAGRWTLGASFRYATGQAFTPAAARYLLRDPATGEIRDNGQVLPAPRNSARLLPYHRLDLSARRDFGLFGLPAELVLEVFNIYNRRNEWFVQYSTDGGTVEADMVRMLPLIPSVGVNVEF